MIFDGRAVEKIVVTLKKFDEGGNLVEVVEKVFEKGDCDAVCGCVYESTGAGDSREHNHAVQ